ncbi:imidazole glycerol phosphate synthase subunit HisF [Desulfocurvus sp. DL9XJH121]
MAKRRLIVSLLYRDGVIVQSRRFSHTNVVGSMKIAIEFFNVWEADEIAILNVARQDDNFDLFVQDIHEVSKSSFLPLSVGGWVTDRDRVKMLFDNGADKVVVNTRLFDDPDFARAIASQYGNQALVAAIDARLENGRHMVYVDRGRRPVGLEAAHWARKVELLGAGEILLTSIDQDGQKNGYDLELMRQVSEAVDIPVIAFGGIQDFTNMADCLETTRIDAVAAGNVFHYFEQSTRKAKNALLARGVDTRVPNNYFKY